EARLGEVVLVRWAQRQRHGRKLRQLARQRIGNQLGGFGARGLDAPRERSEREVDLGPLGSRAVQQRQRLGRLRVDESVVFAPGQVAQRVGGRRVADVPQRAGGDPTHGGVRV